MGPAGTGAKAALVALLLVVAWACPALAHPHVWADIRSQLIVDDNGIITGVRVQWTTDKNYALDALDGFAKQPDGSYSAEELQKLTDENLSALSDYGYFIYFRYDGVPQAIGKPVDGAQTYDPKDGRLTLYFTAPLQKPLDPKKGVVSLKVYDPEYFIDFEYVKDKPLLISKPVPAGCTAELLPIEGDAGLQQTKDMLATKDRNWKPDPSEDFGAMFAQAAQVKCGS